jgi:hypothetical protein
VALLLVVPGRSASADAFGYGWSDGAGVGAGAEAREPVETPAARRSNGSHPQCTYSTMNANETEIADHMAQTGVGPSRGDGPGAWYWKTCVDENGNAWAVVAWIPQRTDPQSVARQALRYTKLPDPAIQMSPPPDQGAIVNVPLWLWIDRDAWQPTSATASVDGVTVTATATPDRVIWRLGDGGQVTCDGPGVPYDPARPEADQHSDCTHVFDRSGLFPITATVEWRATWNVAGGTGGGDLGVVQRTSSTTIQVSEIQALNRPPQ